MNEILENWKKILSENSTDKVIGIPFLIDDCIKISTQFAIYFNKNYSKNEWKAFGYDMYYYRCETEQDKPIRSIEQIFNIFIKENYGKL